MAKPLTSDGMALLETCCGCSLAISSAVLGVYLLVAYLIAFIIELWWILDPSVTAPIPAYLLCLGYFVLFAFSAILLHGLSIKRTAFLLLWLFMMGILLGPEAGLVLYMSIHYWKITSINGLIEITCWACRLLVNVAGILCVQSLHSTWREEKSVLLRLEALKTQAPLHKISDSINHRGGKGFRVPPSIKSYNNQGYVDDGDDDIVGNNCISAKMSESKMESENFDIDHSGVRKVVDDHFENDEVFQNRFYNPLYPVPHFGPAFNEFNASSFDPSIIDARLPYLTIRQKPKTLFDSARRLRLPTFPERRLKFQIMPKTNSLLDLSADKLKNVEVVKFQGNRMSPPLGASDPWYFSDGDDDGGCDDSIDQEDDAGDKDMKIIKNKNLKILKRLSPFNRKKCNEIVNVYRINPPGTRVKNGGPDGDESSLDTKLNRIYKSRGMYAFEEKTRKVVFYPPEFFQGFRGPGFRGFRLSSTSSLSQSSIDSEDIKHISDVAL